MLQRILQLIVEEDSFKIFTSHNHHSVFTAAQVIKDPTNIVEIEGVFLRFFTHFLQGQDPNSFIFNEARRILSILERLFIEIRSESQMQQPSVNVERDENDELVDLYMESLEYFINGIEEPVLLEHFKYLER